MKEFEDIYSHDKETRKELLKKFDKKVQFNKHFDPYKLFDGKHKGFPKLDKKEIRKLKCFIYQMLTYADNKFLDKYPGLNGTYAINTAVDILASNDDDRIFVYEDEDDMDGAEPILDSTEKREFLEMYFKHDKRKC